MNNDREHKPKMAVNPTAPPGLELDEHGRPIPFENRTEDDQQKVRDNIAAALHGLHSVKNPENDAENPASMPRSPTKSLDAGSASNPKALDAEGND